MSTFRDRVANELVTVARHPSDVYDILGVLQEALRSHVQAARDDDQDVEYVAGLHEQWALLSNLRADVAREYGYKEGVKNGIVRGG